MTPPLEPNCDQLAPTLPGLFGIGRLDPTQTEPTTDQTEPTPDQTSVESEGRHAD